MLKTDPIMVKWTVPQCLSTCLNIEKQSKDAEGDYA